MFRIGIHLSYWQRQWSDPLPPLVKRAAAIGFDGVEVPLLQPDHLPLRELQEVLAETGLEVTTGTGLDPSTDISSPDPAVRRAGIAHLRRCIETAAALGAQCLGGVIYAPWGVIHPTHERAARRERMVRSLREVALIAAGYNVTLNLEVLNRFEGYLCTSVDEGKRLLSDVGHPSLKLHLDTFHLNIEADGIGQAIREAGSDLGHFHLSENNRRLPGTGHIPWHEVRDALRAIRYDGWLTVESYVLPHCQVGDALAIWRPLGDDLDAEAARSLNFIRTVFCSGEV